MLSTVLTVLLIVGVVSAAILYGVWHAFPPIHYTAGVHGHTEDRRLAHLRRRRLRRWLLSGTYVMFAVALHAAVLLSAFGKQIAGAGDAPASARAWAEKHRPDWRVSECQPIDSDGNRYVTCLLVRYADDEPYPIECGVNRWYHGWRVSGCRPLIYARGGAR